MKEKILHFLRQQPGFVSGQDICEQLGVSRTAVWKYINALREEGYEIESVTRKGYRLLQSPDLLTREEVCAHMEEGILKGQIHCYASVDSTNEEAKRAAADHAPDGSLFVADQQTAGKGRRGRVWSSPGGEDLFFSLLLRPDIPAESASMLTLLTALAAAAVVDRYTGLECQIKWPNDLVLNDRKLCGILTEMGVEMNEITYVVIGVGVNMNRLDFEEEISSMATSLRAETGNRVERAAFLADFIKEFMARYQVFLREQDLRSFVSEYNDRLINVGRQVKVVTRNREIIRTALGINDKGELILRDTDGHTETVFTGEVSVRGLYGYV